MAIACLKVNSDLNFVGIYSVIFFYHLSVWPITWMIVTEILPSNLLCLPILAFYISKLLFFIFFSSELEQKSIKLFGVSIFFKAFRYFLVLLQFLWCLQYLIFLQSEKQKICQEWTQ